MKLTFNWLKEHLETSASLAEICEKLTFTGLEVESVEDKAKSLNYFSVAKIIEAKPCENSSKLKVCQVQVDNSDKLLQIICGASNARSGLKVAYAPIGSVIPASQMVIKKAKIAGVESNGMLCSAAELGLGIDGEGIIEIDEKWPIGSKITEVFAQNDAIIEINVTPNRGDCLGIYGVARDLAASGIGKLKNLEFSKIDSAVVSPIQIKNNAVEACGYAAFRYFKNVKNCESPKWLKEKLNAVGINSISAIVDITNYVMMVLNRPMHAYDASKIDGSLNIRFAETAEKFVSLKNEEFVLDEKILVIADDKKALGIAGIIGSNNSGCSLETTEILLESALFDAVKIADAGRKLNLQTDARYRFERGVDVETCESGILLATKLILEICGGSANDVILVGNKPAKQKIDFSITKIKKLTGLEVAADLAVEILTKLGFVVEKQNKDELSLIVPSHRHDISCAEDLVEEVVRILGYDKIAASSLPADLLKTEAENIKPNLLHKFRSHLVFQGMIETINWSFCDVDLAKTFGEENKKLTLKNPISVELGHMRPNLLIGLLLSYNKNKTRGFSNLSLFETGNVFLENRQELMVAGIRIGQNKPQNHYHDEREFDVFDVKKDLLDLLEISGINPKSVQLDASSPPKYYHPHRFAAVKLGKNIIGYFGEIHPAIAKKFEIKNRINAFEVFANNLPAQIKSTTRKAFEVSDLQMVERDFAFLINKNQAIGDLIKTINNCDKQLIKEVNIFDIYTGKNIDESKKSVALRVIIQPLEKTLTSEEIEFLSKKIIEAVEKNHQASLRS